MVSPPRGRSSYGADPAAQLDDLAADLTDTVLVATSSAWTAPGIHWHSTTRKIARHSTRPVLVVPAGYTAAIQ